MADDAGTVRLADVAAQLRRQWRTVLGVALALTVCAALAGVLVPRSYTATAVLTVSPIPANPLLDTQPEQKTDTGAERAVVVSTEVAKRAKKTLHSEQSPARLADRIDTGSPSESSVLEVHAAASSATQAARTANAFARGYLDLRTDQARNNHAKLRANLKRRIDKNTAVLTEQGSGASADAARRQLNNLQGQQTKLAGTVIDPGSVVTAATTDDAEPSIALAVYLAGGLVLGLLLGIAAGLVRERFARNVGSAARLATRTEVPVLGQDRAELVDRLAARAGLTDSAPMVTVAVLGTEPGYANDLGVALAQRLERTGMRPVVVPDEGERPPAPAPIPDRRTAVNLVTITVPNGLARALHRAHGADYRIVVVTPKTPLSGVLRLLEELDIAGNSAKVVAVLDTPSAPTATVTAPARPAELVE